MPTASAIIDVVRLRVDHAALSTTQALGLINKAQRVMQRRFPLRWQETIAPQQTVATSTSALQSFTLPTDYKAINAVYAIVSGEHDLVEYQDDFFGLVDEMAGATSATQPSWWTQHGDLGYFFPPLSSSLQAQVFYEKLLADLVLTGANSFTDKAPEVLEDAATAEYYDTIAEPEKAQVWHAKADAGMQLVLKQHRATTERARVPVPKTPGTLRRRKRTTYRGYTWW